MTAAPVQPPLSASGRYSSTRTGGGSGWPG